MKDGDLYRSFANQFSGVSRFEIISRFTREFRYKVSKTFKDFSTPKVLCLALSAACTSVVSEPLRVVTEELPPYNFSDGQYVAGLSTQLVRAVVTHAGIDATFEVLPWPRAFRIAKQQKNVLIYSIFRTPEREKHFIWLWALAPFNYSVYANSPKTHIKIPHLGAIEQHTIGVLRDSAQVDLIRSFSNIDETNILIGANYEQLYLMLRKERIDMFLAPDLLVSYLNQKYHLSMQQQPTAIFPLEIGETEVFAAASINTDPMLVKRIKEAAQELKQDGTLAAIKQQYSIE